MPAVLIVFVAVIVISLGFYGFVRANPGRLANRLRRVLPFLIGGLGVVFLATGRFAMIGMSLLGYAAHLFRQRGTTGFGGEERSGPAQSRRSKVRARYLAMELDHESGAMSGTVLEGPFAGRALDSLDPAELAAFHQTVRTAVPQDVDSLTLLETYLDRTVPGWREDFHAQDNARHGGAPGAGTISEQEAYEVLGLSPGASIADIRAAHRRLMMKLHPDRGGSTVLAAKVNQAKDILLRNHSSTS